MIERVLPATRALPVWRRASVRVLEDRLASVSALALMDLAGLASARLALALAPHARCIWVLAGPGNNGGDGLEAAMHLHRWGRQVLVSCLADPQQWPADAQRAWQRARAAGVPMQTGLPATPPALGPQDLCMDALLGIGAHRAPQGELLRAIDCIGHTQGTVLALDVPTGLDADSGQPLGSAASMVHAHHTLTMLGLKPGLLMGHGRDACGTLWLAPLGLSPAQLQGCPPDAETNPPPPAPVRQHASHKGSHGDVAVVGGQGLGEDGMGMGGAAVLAAMAALHGGAGRVMLSLLGPHDASLPVPPDLMRRDLAALELTRLTVVAGCGGGRAMAGTLGRLLQHSARLVLDADALNAVAQDPWLQTLLAARATRHAATVLTPHPLEAARLLGSDTAQVQTDRLGAAAELVRRFGCCVALKGSGTVLAAPGQAPRINTTGNGLLATGGTGDVLAGLLGARLATSGQAWSAACDAVWTHGQCADQWPPGQALTASALAASLR